MIVTSDHGEEFYEHGENGHGMTVYNEVLHVPLVIRAPGRVPAGARPAGVVDLSSLPATVVGLTGLAAGSPFPGTSLAAHWADHPADGGAAFAEIQYDLDRQEDYQKAKSLYAGPWHLIVEESGITRLYRVDRDPQEWDDLHATAEGGQMVAELGARLERYLTAQDWEQYRRFLA